MRKFILLLTILVSTTMVAQTVNIPDSNFEQALIELGIDTNGLNGNIDITDAFNVTSLTLFNEGISDLTGIEAFTNLQALFCGDNQLTFINLSQNTSLFSLNLETNLLTALDISQNTSLRFIYCANNLLESLDVSNNTILFNLDVSNNVLTDLNIQNGNNSNINTFDARNNPDLNCIQVDNVMYSDDNWTNIDPQTSFNEDCTGGLTYVPDDNFEQALIDLGYDSGALDDYVPTANINTLTLLAIQNQNITDLTGIEDFTALQLLDCNNNQLTNVDLSSNTALTGVFFPNNQLVILNLKNGNTSNFEDIGTNNNPNLLCIEVDDAAYATANLSDDIDVQTSYSEDCSGVQTYVPDGNFEQALIDLGYDSGPLNDFVPTNTINTVTDLSISNKGINDLTGIEDFEALENLFCGNNNLTTIDISQNTTLVGLGLSDNELTTLDITNNPNLTFLSVYSNALTSLNVTQNLALESLLCNSNALQSLSLDANTSLEFLNCSTNSILNLNVSNNLALVVIRAEGNGLSSITFNSLPNLIELTCSGNLLSSINTSALPNLQELSFSYNLITSIDASTNTQLVTFNGQNNALTSLNVRNGNNSNFIAFSAINNPDLFCIEVDDVDYSESNWPFDPQTDFREDCSGPQTYVPDDNFEQALIDQGYDSGPLDDFVPTNNIDTIPNLNVSNNNISDLTGIADFTELENLNCGNNQLTNLDVSQNSSLTLLHLSNNLLTSIDITQNLALTYCAVNNNQLTTIDVTQNNMLLELFVKSNQLTSLNTNQNSALILIDCEDNLLTTLELGQNTVLEEIYCKQNLLTTLDLSQNTALLDIDCDNNELSSLNVKNNNNTNILSFFSRNNPNLTCIEVDNAAYSEANWVNIDAQTIFSEDCSTLSTNSFDIENRLTVYPNPASNIVYIKTANNAAIDNIEVINLSGKRVLTVNSKTSIDVSSLASGIYLLKITLDNQETIKKLIIQ